MVKLLGKTLSVSSQDLKKNANTPSLRVGGVTGGIKARSYDHSLALHIVIYMRRC